MILKYIFDRLVSLMGLLVLSPLLLIVAVIIAIKMPNGPIIFSQKRVGKDGKHFVLVKFRNMNNKTDTDGKLLPPAHSDPDFAPKARHNFYR